MSDGRKALVYAEETLGVHEVYKRAETARATLDTVLTELSATRDRLRDMEFRLSDRENEVAADERGKHPDMSVSGMEKHLKVALNNDDATRELREQIAKLKSDVEGLDYDRHMSDTDIRIAVARMEQLGGYFHYLAVVKEISSR